MIRPLRNTAWDTSALAGERRAYIDKGLSFEEIALRVIGSAAVISSRIEPYGTAPPGEEDGRQIIFVVRVAPQTCDLLYNAPDGLRGRYWQSPDHGFSATRYLIHGLLPTLMVSFANQSPALPNKCPPMSADDINISLEGLSAKVWPRELDDARRWLFKDDHLKVPRWEPNHGEKGPMWRQSPTSDDLEIKGALIGADGTEYIPEGKRDRSCQIHRFGFT
jgi:hypothetical protein